MCWNSSCFVSRFDFFFFSWKNSMSWGQSWTLLYSQVSAVFGVLEQECSVNKTGKEGNVVERMQVGRVYGKGTLFWQEQTASSESWVHSGCQHQEHQSRNFVCRHDLTICIADSRSSWKNRVLCHFFCDFFFFFSQFRWEYALAVCWGALE